MPFIKLAEANVNANMYGVDFKNSESLTSVEEKTLAKIRAHGLEYSVRSADKHEIVRIEELEKTVADLESKNRALLATAKKQDDKFNSLEKDYAALMNEFIALNNKHDQLLKQRFVFEKLNERNKGMNAFTKMAGG